MNILEEKGHLTRRKEGRAYRYETVRPKSQVISGMVDDFVGRVFEGSATPLILSLVKNKKIPRKDLEEIARLLAEVRAELAVRTSRGRSRLVGESVVRLLD